jgi:hypothetical protein
VGKARPVSLNGNGFEPHGQCSFLSTHGKEPLHAPSLSTSPPSSPSPSSSPAPSNSATAATTVVATSALSSPPSTYDSAAKRKDDQRMASESGVGAKRKLQEVGPNGTQQQQPQQRQQKPQQQQQPQHLSHPSPSLPALDVSAVFQQLKELMNSLATITSRLIVLEAELGTVKASMAQPTHSSCAPHSLADLHTGQAISNGLSSNSSTTAASSAHG